MTRRQFALFHLSFSFGRGKKKKSQGGQGFKSFGKSQWLAGREFSHLGDSYWLNLITFFICFLIDYWLW